MSFPQQALRTPQASIESYRGSWFRYAVHRTFGSFIPEGSVTLHRTLRGAERAKRRWEKRAPNGERIV
jgi:hypothetical protein